MADESGVPGSGQRPVAYRRARASDRAAVFRVLATANFDDVPSPEMPQLDLERFFVAESEGRIVGVAGYTILEDGRGKTTLMAVDPEHRGRGIGGNLQKLRMLEMRRKGCSSVVTNADRPETISWYRRKFGYRAVGRIEKLHEFGAPDVDHWTTLEADLDHWYRELYEPGD